MRTKVRTLGVVISTIAALVTSTVAVAAAPAATSDEEDYLCAESVEICEAAAQQAGGSAQRAEQYLRDYAIGKAASPPPAQFAIAAAGTGYLINPSPTGRRYYGWRLSRSMAHGHNIGFYRCRLLNRRLVYCRYIGDIGVQAEYFLRNRYVSDISTVVVNLMATENFKIRHAAICMPPSGECIPQPGVFVDLFAGSRSEASPRDFQLRTRGSYWMSFQWEMYDPVTRKTALTSAYFSLPFSCGPYNPPTNPGDCFFDGGGGPGGGH